MAANAVISLLALILFVCLFYGPWQAACTDWVRQIIFERRDRLFDMAAAGKLDFASEEYKFIRRTLEGMIRFAHDLTWPRLLFFRLVRRDPRPAARPQLLEMIDRIEDLSVRKQVIYLVDECTLRLIVVMALKSIFVAPVAFVMWFIVLCSTGFKFLVRNNSIVENLSETILTEAQFT
jgi:hypothetical protein